MHMILNSFYVFVRSRFLLFNIFILSIFISFIFPGEYRVGIKFNDQHIPDSPHKVYISPAMGDAHKLEVAQFPESGVQPDKPYTFLVRKNGAKGELFAKVIHFFSERLVTSVIWGGHVHDLW